MPKKFKVHTEFVKILKDMDRFNSGKEVKHNGRKNSEEYIALEKRLLNLLERSILRMSLKSDAQLLYARKISEGYVRLIKFRINAILHGIDESNTAMLLHKIQRIESDLIKLEDYYRLLELNKVENINYINKSIHDIDVFLTEFISRLIVEGEGQDG